MKQRNPKRGSAEEKRWFKAVAELETCVLCGEHGIQVAHSNQDRGLGQKSAPWLTAPLCPSCHVEIDSGKNLSKLERHAWMDRAIVRTHDKLIRNGVLKLEVK